MGNTTDVQPRTLSVELSNSRFMLIMPIHRLECENKPPHWYFMIKTRISKSLTVVPAGKITVDCEWIEPPRIQESILEASYYLPFSKIVDVPSDILEEIAMVTCDYSFKLREAYFYNQSLGYAYDDI